MWEPINEPEASTCAAGASMADCYPHLTCPDPARSVAALRRFFDDIGTLIRSIDGNHLIESGSIGGTQCGWAGSGFTTVGASSGIDVTSFHAYGADVFDQRSLNDRVAATRSLGKPILVGEMGVKTGGAGCTGNQQRAAGLAAVTDSMLAAGAAGVALWNYALTPQAGCTYDVGPTDALMGRLRGR